MNNNKPEVPRERKSIVLTLKIRQVAIDLGISETILYGWRTKKRQGGDTPENQKLQHDEMAHLRLEC